MRRRGIFPIVLITALLLLFGVSWWTLVLAPSWPLPVFVIGTVVFAAGAVGFPLLMRAGHLSGHSDTAARIGDTTLGVIWVCFAWSVIGEIVRLVLVLSGVDGLSAARIMAFGVLAIVVVLVGTGHAEAMRQPRVRAVDVVLPRLGRGADGLRIAVLADTHFGPINRARWSARLVERVNELAPDVVCHVGDLADGTVEQRRAQVEPLRDVRGTKLYITGNHEYFSQAQEWLDHMACLGWEPMHNRHRVVERGGDRVVFAGIDDPTGRSSGLEGHGPNLAAALAGAEPDLPVVLLAHQPKQSRTATGVDLQLSGHTHGGQIWPFHLLVRLEQGFLHGLRRSGDTQVYTSRGAGFWGPPLRVFAPSELTLLTLRSVSPATH